MCLTLGVYYYTIIISYTYIYYYILYIILLLYYYTLLCFTYLSFLFFCSILLFLFLSQSSFCSSSFLPFPLLPILIPIHLYSFYTCRYLHILIYTLPAFQTILTPHKVSEVNVEWCSFISMWCSFRFRASVLFRAGVDVWCVLYYTLLFL